MIECLPLATTKGALVYHPHKRSHTQLQVIFNYLQHKYKQRQA